MTPKPLINTLFIAGIVLLMTGCGSDDRKDPPSEGQTPVALPDTLKVKRLSKTYVITGIGVSGSNSVAIINNQVLKPGVEIDPGVMLKDIHPTYATIIHGNTEYLLRPENIQTELNKKKH